MIALIPVFIKKDSLSWQTPECIEIILHILRAAKGSTEIHKALVFTDIPWIKDLASSEKIESFLMDQKHGFLKSEFLPKGTMQCINNLNSIHCQKSEHIMILNMRNPAITSDLIDSAIAEYYGQNSSHMISVTHSENNPCQLEAYYRIEDVGLIHFLDNMDCNNCNLLRTMPFPYDWASRGIKKAKNGDIFSQEFNKEKICYSPVSTEDQPIIRLVNFWCYEDQHRARIIFDTDNYKFLIKRINPGRIGVLSGAAFWDNTVSTVIYTNHNEYHLYFNSELFSKDVSILKIMPIAATGPLEDNIQEYFLCNLSEKIILKLPDVELTGIAFYLLKPADNDSYDFTEPFPSDDRLWTNTVPKRNVITGKEILGRQDFPEIFEPDKSIMITRWDNISEIKTRMEITKATPFIMPEGNSILIETEFDLLEYRAVLKAEYD